MKRTGLLPCTLILLSFACGSNSKSTPSGYSSRSDDLWKTKDISICFTQSSPQFAEAKTIITEGLQQEYSAVGFRFKLLEQCSQQPSIAISFVGGGTSRVDVIGSGVRTVQLGTGHFCFDASGHAVDLLQSNCIRNVAVHEFGHALGLHHEMNRRDNGDQCNLDQTHGRGEYNAIQLGDYDPLSVMNYCQVLRMNLSNSRMSLSPGDLNTLRALYEGPTARVDRLPDAYVGSPSAISFHVTGPDVTEFQIKFGPRDATDCKQADGYSRFLPIDYLNTGEELVREFLGADASVSGVHRICLIGRNAAKTQPLVSYSSIDVEFP